MSSTWTKIQIGAIILLIIILTRGVNLYTEYLWYQGTGYPDVFLTILKAKLLIIAAGAAALITFAVINAFIANRAYTVSKTRKGETEIIIPENLNTIVIGALAAIAILFGISLSASWETVLRYINRQPFGITDPVFERDVGFFIFELPLFESALRAGFAILLVTIITVLGLYLLKSKSMLFEIAFSNLKLETPQFTSRAKAHLLILLSLVFLLLGVNYKLQTYNLLLASRSDVFFGPGYTDLTVTLPVLNFLVFISILSSVSLLSSIWTKKYWPTLALIALLFGTQIIGLGLYAGLIQEYRVRPNELSLETPYIKNNIESTIQAFGLERVNDRMFDINHDLTADSITRNSPTIENIRLWDPRPLKDTYGQLQEIRLYYEFNDVDVDRYTVDERYVQLMLSARELDTSKLEPSAQNWINMHLVYTHGYGVVASPVNRATKQGLPALLVKDIPPESTQFPINRPEIYFGEMTKNYVIVNTKQEEFDYPQGNENMYTTYALDSGVVLDTYFKKLAMAIRFGTPKILLSNDITRESRILFDRDINLMAVKLASFLSFDKDPYLVVTGDGLKWILDGYTASKKYPYSTPHSGINYVRNPVKVVIDAYSGEADLYIVDEKDPIIATYLKIFPSLFKEFQTMPPEIKAHLRYPEDMFTIQANVYSRYHMKDPRVFYNLEDMWNVPNELYEAKRIKMTPYYIIMRLPGEEREEFILMLPFTPRNKDNMIAWMYARSDPEVYGELGVFKFPKKELIFGPSQIEARIDQDESISEQLTLWGQVGSRVIRGNLLVIPVENSILYVEPLYLLAEQSQLPELKRVIVAYGDRIVMKEDLGSALAEIFGEAETIAPPDTGEIEGPEPGLPTKALEHYNKALDALKTGDWKQFGEELNLLEDALKKLKETESS